MSLTFKKSLDFGWPELHIIFWLVQLEKTGDDDRRHSSYIFAVGATTTESGRPEHIGTWGIFPITSKEKCQRKAQPYRGKLNGKNSTTPRSSTSLGPRRKKLYEEPEPWLRGFAPKSRNEHEPFVNGQALGMVPRHGRKLVQRLRLLWRRRWRQSGQRGTLWGGRKYKKALKI